MTGYRIELSDECMRGDHGHCDGMIYRKNRDGTMEVIGPCQCGCHIAAESLKGKDMERTIRKAKNEERVILDSFCAKFRKKAEVEV